MSLDWSVRPYQPGDEAGILELFNRVFAEGDPNFSPRTRAHWSWQFRDNPLGHQTHVAVEPGGAIVGLYTAIPGRWLLDGEPIVAAQAVDTCVDARHRRMLKREGLFLTLARTWFDAHGRPERDQIVYGFPNPVAFRIGTRQLDYRPVHVPVVALVRDFDAAWIDYLGGMGADRFETREVPGFDAEADELAARMERRFRLVQRRSRRYLEWRYSACPTHAYRVLETRAKGTGELRGILVLRTSWFDKPLAPLVDWILPDTDPEPVAALARHAALLARDAGQARMETWVPLWSDPAASLRRIGFAEDPSRFNLCIRWFGPPHDESWAAKHWYFAMADSDIF